MQYSIRDLLWLTVVVALLALLGASRYKLTLESWRHQQLVEAEETRAKYWQTAYFQEVARLKAALTMADSYEREIILLRRKQAFSDWFWSGKDDYNPADLPTHPLQR